MPPYLIVVLPSKRAPYSKENTWSAVDYLPPALDERSCLAHLYSIVTSDASKYFKFCESLKMKNDSTSTKLMIVQKG